MERAIGHIRAKFWQSMSFTIDIQSPRREGDSGKHEDCRTELRANGALDPTR